MLRLCPGSGMSVNDVIRCQVYTKTKKIYILIITHSFSICPANESPVLKVCVRACVCASACNCNQDFSIFFH